MSAGVRISVQHTVTQRVISVSRGNAGGARLTRLGRRLVHEVHEGPGAPDVGEGDLAQALQLGVGGVLVRRRPAGGRRIPQQVRGEEAQVVLMQFPVLVLACLQSQQASSPRLRSQHDRDCVMTCHESLSIMQITHEYGMNGPDHQDSQHLEARYNYLLLCSWHFHSQAQVQACTAHQEVVVLLVRDPRVEELVLDAQDVVDLLAGHELGAVHAAVSQQI